MCDADRPAAASSSHCPARKHADNDTEDKKTPALVPTSSQRSGASEYPEPNSEYEERWEWAPEVEDYVRLDENNERLLYTEYQMRGITRPQPLRGDEFQIVVDPKKFFQPGRIFAVDWFEPAPADVVDGKAPPGALVDGVHGPNGGRAVCKPRWFVVVRRRPHHSLCFRITTYGGPGAPKTNRGRAEDFVVLHRANVRPARPYDDEKITRTPIAVIIEAPDQYISPIARLDCGRIYTVEDNLKVSKIGRVHPSHKDLLNQYFRDSVL
ncbi:hypothetical protein VTH06DRAFT_5009 [Thermothelomyces fergusii]